MRRLSSAQMNQPRCTASYQTLLSKQFLLAYAMASMALTLHAETTPACPTAIQPESIQLNAIPAGWTSYVAAPLYLHSAAPMDGPPEELGELAGFRQEKIPGGWRHRYDLDIVFPHGKWLVCRYGASGHVTLARKLDDSFRTCSFSYRKGEHVGENRISITCK